VSKWAGWKDTQLRVEGPAAQQLQDVFVEDWYFASGEDLTSKRYLKGVPSRGDSLVQIVPSGPDQDRNVLEQIYFSAFHSAKRSIRISTPYFVPDPGILLALQNAAYRGVAVEILIPSKTDAPLVLWAGRSYYQDLLEAGVAVYEFDEGFLHSKTITIDGRWSLVGSANMDVRSFLLNFEATATIFDAGMAQILDADFLKYRSRSRAIRRQKDSKGRFLPSVIEGAARLMSPLL
jgi:cardiolipin synthase